MSNIFIANQLIFKGENAHEMFDGQEFVEVTEVTPDYIEIGFDGVHKQRIYLRFKLEDLVRCAWSAANPRSEK